MPYRLTFNGNKLSKTNITGSVSENKYASCITKKSQKGAQLILKMRGKENLSWNFFCEI